MQSADTGRPGYHLGVYDKEWCLVGSLPSGPSTRIAYLIYPDTRGRRTATGSVTAFTSDCFDRFRFKQLSFDQLHKIPSHRRVLCKAAL